jgi:glycine/D-amino acid oxidase-like deaminating enzyme
MARPATVVTGAGVVGCLTARELTARDPEVSITVPDRDRAPDRIVFAGAANGSGCRLAPAMASQAVDLLSLHRSEGVTSDHQYV